MKSQSINCYKFILLVFLIGMFSVVAQAQEEDLKAAMKADKTGTNPINFQNELRFYNEYQWLNSAGDGYQNITTLEYRTPILGGKWQVRVKARNQMINADLNDDGVTDIDEGGWGDTDVRLLTVPYMNMQTKTAIAFGIEAFLDTAKKDSLGSGATVLGPQVFGAFFGVLGFDLIAPAYQHRFSVDTDSRTGHVEQGFIDVFGLKMSKDKQVWMLINPTLIMDYEANTKFLLFDVELGTMLDEYLGTKGHSAYVRPSVSFGADRGTDASIEVGYKIIW